MPILTRWFIKTALVYLIAALIAGVLQAAGPFPLAAVLGPVYIHLLVVGWITQIVFGVAYWMFPKYSQETPRGNDGLAIASYACVNAGLLLRVFGEPAHTLHPTAGLGWTLVLSAILQWIGGMAFVLNTWSRIKER